MRGSNCTELKTLGLRGEVTRVRREWRGRGRGKRKCRELDGYGVVGKRACCYPLMVVISVTMVG